MNEQQMRQIMVTAMKYRIRWTAKLTGASGFGTGTFSKSEAEKIVETLNDQKDNLCIHEMVLVDKADKEKKEGYSEREIRQSDR